MTMKTSYRKIYLFLLLLTSYSCNDLTETNMSIDIISMTKYNNIINIDSSETFIRILLRILHNNTLSISYLHHNDGFEEFSVLF